MNDAEIWKPIDGYEGFYEVSSHGRIRSIGRWVIKFGFRNVYLQESIKAQQTTTTGYLHVILFRESKGRIFKAHRIVAKTFIPNPNLLPVVNHLDGDKKNNFVSNLEWCTQSENTKHSYTIGRPRLHGERTWTAKVKNADVLNIRLLSSQGMRVSELAGMYPLSKRSISSIIRKQTWRHL